MGKPDVHRRAMHPGQACRDLHRLNHSRRLHGAHGNHQRALEHARRLGGHMGFEHGDVFALLHMPQGDARIHQGALKRERAANHKADPIVLPEVPDVGHLFAQHAVAPHPVHGQVGSDVDVFAQIREGKVTRCGHAQHRAGLGVELAKAGKVFGMGLGQDDQVALHMVPGQARCVATQHTRARLLAYGLGVGGVGGHGVHVL